MVLPSSGLWPNHMFKKRNWAPFSITFVTTCNKTTKNFTVLLFYMCIRKIALFSKPKKEGDWSRLLPFKRNIILFFFWFDCKMKLVLYFVPPQKNLVLVFSFLRFSWRHKQFWMWGRTTASCERKVIVIQSPSPLPTHLEAHTGAMADGARANGHH